eukprot:9832897-Ditylum_brightwellii.AAC.1
MYINDEEVAMGVNVYDVHHYCNLLPLLIEATPDNHHNQRPCSLITSEAIEMDDRGEIVCSKFVSARYESSDKNVGFDYSDVALTVDT